MARNFYENLQVAFPELKKVPLPDELDRFEHFVSWLNSYHTHLQRLDGHDFSLKQLDHCYRLQQLNLDLDELKNEIREELQSVYQLYDDDDDDDDEADADARDMGAFYATEIGDNVILNTLKLFIEPYDLAVVVLDHEEPYWMIVPNQPELLSALSKNYAQTFGEEQEFLVLE